MPVMVFDREGYGADFFFAVKNEGIDFVTWDKFVDTQKLDAFAAAQFNEELKVNSNQYLIFEDEKGFTAILDNKEEISFSLPPSWKIAVMWSLSRRTTGPFISSLTM
jgi:hypothetical protein